MDEYWTRDGINTCNDLMDTLSIFGSVREILNNYEPVNTLLFTIYLPDGNCYTERFAAYVESTALWLGHFKDFTDEFIIVCCKYLIIETLDTKLKEIIMQNSELPREIYIDMNAGSIINSITDCPIILAYVLVRICRLIHNSKNITINLYMEADLIPSSVISSLAVSERILLTEAIGKKTIFLKLAISLGFSLSRLYRGHDQPKGLQEFLELLGSLMNDDFKDVINVPIIQAILLC